MSKYRVLAIDGGGIRGVLTALLLERLDSKFPGFLDRCDLLAGTSTGAIIACGLADGMLPGDLVDLYQDRGPKIFDDSVLDNIKDLGAILGAEYSTKNRLEVIQGVFGDKTLDDLLPRHVLISSFDLRDDTDHNIPEDERPWKAKFFHNYPGPDSDGTEKIVDVLMRSSAAPVYFPIYQGYIDGGVVANNPAMCALAQALHPKTAGQSIADVVLLSVGTGRREKNVDSQDGDWGLMKWGLTLVNVLFDGAMGLADYQCRQLLRERYGRLDPKLHADIGLDELEAIPHLLNIADSANMDDAERLLSHHWITD